LGDVDWNDRPLSLDGHRQLEYQDFLVIEYQALVWSDGRPKTELQERYLRISVAFPSSYMALIEQAASRRAG
jgi:hypothetical protein